MRTRHRTPTIFSLSMVDVLCCALGCVLLLWLWNLRKAQDFQYETEEKARLLAATARDKGDLDKELARLRAEAASRDDRVLSLEGSLAEAATRRSLTEKELDALRALLDKERGKTADLDKEKASLLDRLRAAQALADRLPGLEKDLAAVRDKEKEAAALLALARDKEKQSGELLRSRDADLADLARRVQALTTDKAALEKTMAALEKSASTNAGEMRATQTTLTSAQARVRELEKELAANIRSLLNLQDDKKALEAQLAKTKADEQNRFAGIALSGRRVVFLVDTSLSMIETADGKPFPEKWTAVAETVVKVMKSLPDLESYQLVLFSRDASYPLGQAGEWLRYDPAVSPDLVKRTLLDPKNKPDGGTNMYAGLEQAFRLRAAHLDTVYLFSDGLPSRGPGVEANVATTLTTTELARRLGDHVRKSLRTEWNKAIPNLPNVRIHSIGFFYDSPDVGAFLWAMSRENDGNFVGMSRP